MCKTTMLFLGCSFKTNTVLGTSVNFVLKDVVKNDVSLVMVGGFNTLTGGGKSLSH